MAGKRVSRVELAIALAEILANRVCYVCIGLLADLLQRFSLIRKRFSTSDIDSAVILVVRIGAFSFSSSGAATAMASATIRLVSTMDNRRFA